MSTNSSKRFLIIPLLTTAAMLSLVSCGGDTGGDGETFDGSSYNDDNSGDVRLDIVESRLPVGGTSGFRVQVLNSAGQAVPNIQIACDTETGLALLEPTSGFELTDSTGHMSGRVGCVTPGSYQIGCRLPVGTNQRDFQTIICEGPVPAGFNGFPGAGGGSLGTGTGTGGAVPPANNGTILITSVVASENDSDTISIDVEQGTCGREDQNGDGDTTDDGDFKPEEYTDTILKFTVKNETAEAINLSSFSYDISGASGSGTSFSSNELAFVSGGNVPAGSSVTLTGLFLRAGGGRKFFNGSSTAISTSTGFRNVSITLFGTAASGQSVTAEATVGLSFNNFNKCDE